MSDIDVHDDPQHSCYDALVDGRPAGYAAYRKDGTRITFTHTEVDSSFEGHGVGSGLIRYALDDARRQNLHVIAQCPFVASFIEHHDEYADLLVH